MLVDMKLEVVVIPVTDVDRAKNFYAGLGWRLDADFPFDNGFRVVQFTPPGAPCSVQFGSNITTAAPGSAQGLYLVVSDIQAAVDELEARGAKPSGVFHPGAPGAQFKADGSGRLSGRADKDASYGSFATFSDPDGNTWLLQEITTRLPGRVDAAETAFASAAALQARGLHVAVVERELVGGECSYWACIPSKSLLRPGEAVNGARNAAATAQVDVAAALAWRDFMVSNWSDASAAKWLTSRGIDVLRGNGKLAGTGVVEVDGVRHTAGHVIVATGAEPITPPIPGLRDLDGVWGTREATSMKAVPRRLLVLGGGSAGVEIAQIVRRLGGEVALVEGAPRLIPREAAPLGDALGEALRKEGIELDLGVRATAARRDGDEYVLQLDNGKELRG